MDSSTTKSSYEVVCPHCHKAFEAELLVSSETSGPGGFKCPHCRLFVPFERGEASPAS